MTALIEETRAMLAAFRRSSLRDLHVRTGGWELFLARPGGAANPLMDSAIVQPEAAVAAAHLGLFFAKVVPGTQVDPDTVVAQLELLGERMDVLAGRVGLVTEVLPADGALVEYGEPLIRLAA